MINKIFHISDIHIRLYRRSREYQSVLENLISIINERKDKNSIIIVTGDIFHSKTEMSPESVSLGTLFLNKLSQILPTIVIAGNHDANLSNNNRLDSLSPLISIINEYNKNLLYYKETGWYFYQNLNIWVASVFDERMPQQFPDNNNINICLYHGCVNDPLVNGIPMKSKFSVKDFQGFDFGLLGDIHNGALVSKDPLISYAGSLLQLNFGEQQDSHGILLWHLDDKRLERIDIPNDYSFYNVVVQNGEIIDMPNIDSKYPRIKIKYKNTTHSQLKTIQIQLKQKFNIQQLVLFKLSDNIEQRSSTFKYQLQNLNDVAYQESIIREYIQHVNLLIPKDHLKKMFQINKDLNERLKVEHGMKVSNLWTIERLQFSNFFSYQGDNVVDFRDSKGILGIVGENRSGKCVDPSTTIDIQYDEDEIINLLGFIPEELSEPQNINKKKKVTINQIYNIFKKYGDIGIKVNTPYGYKKIQACQITAYNSNMIKLETETGLQLICSPDHKIKCKNNKFVKASNLYPGQYVKTINGCQRIVSLQILSQKKDLMDIQVQKVKQYYSNGIVSHNSALIDILLFMLFDKSPRASKASALLNKNKTQFFGKLTISINEQIYVIERHGKLSPKQGSVAVRCKFYTYSEEGDVIDLSGTERFSTNVAIQNYIGKYEDAISTFFSTQGNTNTFIESTNSNRKNLLNSLLNLSIFDSCYQQANQRSKYLKGYLNNINIQKVLQLITKKTLEISHLDQMIIQDEQNLSILIEKIDALQINMKNLLSQKKLEDDEVIDINQVQSDIANYKQIIQQKNKELKDLRSAKVKLDQSIAEIKDIIEKIEIQKKRKQSKELVTIENKYKELERSLQDKTYNFNEVSKKMKLLESLQYDENCSYCMNNPLTQDAINSKQLFQDIVEQIDHINSEIDSLQQALQKKRILDEDIRLYDNQIVHIQNQLLKRRSQTLSKESELTKKLMQYKQKLQQSQRNQKSYYSNQSLIENNKSINEQILKLQQELTQLKSQKKVVQQKLLTSKITKSSNNQIVKQNVKTKRSFNKFSEELEILDRYKMIVGRTGVQYYIISNIIMELQIQINRILAMITNFSIQFILNGKSIDINIVYPDKSYLVQTCSGFEKFVISLAIRHALSSITNKSKAKMFVIDQGFGVLDYENISYFNKILAFIADKYETLVIISHLDSMRELLENRIQVTYKDGISRINHDSIK